MRCAMEILLFGTLWAGLAADTARADVVGLKDGLRHEGRVVREDNREVVVEVSYGRLAIRVILPRSNVASIVPGPTANDRLLAEVESRRAALAGDDADGWFAYARWLDGQPGLHDDALAAYRKVIEIEPGHKAAAGKKAEEERRVAGTVEKVPAPSRARAAASGYGAGGGRVYSYPYATYGSYYGYGRYYPYTTFGGYRSGHRRSGHHRSGSSGGSGGGRCGIVK